MLRLHSRKRDLARLYYLAQLQDRKARWLDVLYRDIESSECVLGVKF